MSVERARSLRSRQTDAEKVLWRALRGRQIDGSKFRRQMAIDHFVVDFVCLEQRLIIEVDGGQHAIDVARDADRTSYLEKHGFRVIRFWNNDVLKNLKGVLRKITEALVSK